MASRNNNESEIKSWLEILLQNENLNHFSVEIVGNSEKGDGYMGDIVFVEVNGTTKDGIKKDYSLVLKCAKRSTALREKSPVKEAFLNEIFFYDTIFPHFLQFQKENGVEDLFDNVPKCYGTLIKGEMEVLALENLKKIGYILWDRKKPLTRKHINNVVKGYAKLHSISIAMKQQKPSEFEEMTNKLEDLISKVLETTDFIDAYRKTVDEVCGLLKGELEDDILAKWKSLRNEVKTILTTNTSKMNVMNVIVHGDCWNNNFMHYHIDDEPSTFAMIDWQLLGYASPIFDLSYFLFACLSEEDMNDLDPILKLYHQTLMTQLYKLHVDNPEQLYPFEQFIDEWKRFSRYGFTISMLIHKIALSEKEDAPDMVEAAEKGEDVSSAFTQPIKHVEEYKKKMKYIVKYIVEHDLI